MKLSVYNRMLSKCFFMKTHMAKFNFTVTGITRMARLEEKNWLLIAKTVLE